MTTIFAALSYWFTTPLSYWLTWHLAMGVFFVLILVYATYFGEREHFRAVFCRPWYEVIENILCFLILWPLIVLSAIQEANFMRSVFPVEPWPAKIIAEKKQKRIDT